MRSCSTKSRCEPCKRWEASPASVAPADDTFRGAGQKPVPLRVTFRWEQPPSVGRTRAVELPQAPPPAFCRLWGIFAVLRAGDERAMVTERQYVLGNSSNQMRLLIIEDDRESADYLVKAF